MAASSGGPTTGGPPQGPSSDGQRLRHTQEPPDAGWDRANLTPRDPGSKSAWRRSVLESRRRRLSERSAADREELAQRLAESVLALTRRLPGPVACYASLPGEPPTEELRARLRARGTTVLLPWLRDDGGLDWVRDEGQVTESATAAAPDDASGSSAAGGAPDDASGSSAAGEAPSRTTQPDGSALRTTRQDRSVSRTTRPDRSVSRTTRPDRSVSRTTRPDRLPSRERLRPPGVRLGSGALAGCAVVLLPALAVDTAGRRVGRGGGSYDRALAEPDGRPEPRRSPRPLLVAIVHADRWGAELVPADRTPLPVEPHDQRIHAVLTGDGLHWCEPGATAESSS